MDDDLIVSTSGPTLTVTFNRPAKRNALTMDMVRELMGACDQVDSTPELRAMVFRGAGRDAFVAGADISMLEPLDEFGADGIAYENNVVELLTRIETVQVPTIAAINGYCVGGGIEIAAACDLRIATPSAQFGAPMARTVGNCLSIHAIALLIGHLGPGRTLDMLLRARMIDANAASAAGFLSEICEEDELDSRAAELAEQVASNAPLTMWAFKESVRRIRIANLPDGDDIYRKVYESSDFKEGVSAFLEKRPANWTGR